MKTKNQEDLLIDIRSNIVDMMDDIAGMLTNITIVQEKLYALEEELDEPEEIIEDIIIPGVTVNIVDVDDETEPMYETDDETESHIWSEDGNQIVEAPVRVINKVKESKRFSWTEEADKWLRSAAMSGVEIQVLVDEAKERFNGYFSENSIMKRVRSFNIGFGSKDGVIVRKETGRESLNTYIQHGNLSKRGKQIMIDHIIGYINQKKNPLWYPFTQRELLSHLNTVKKSVWRTCKYEIAERITGSSGERELWRLHDESRIRRLKND